MSECLNSIGFIFKSAKTYIKCDKKNKFNNCKCQECCYHNRYNDGQNCNTCNKIDNYKICIFKLTKENFSSSTLALATSIDDAWYSLKKYIVNLINGFFVISVTKCNKLHSFYASLIKIKMCDCCEVIYLYFKFNIIPMLQCYEPLLNYRTQDCLPSNYWPDSNLDDVNTVCANLISNITYDLKSYEYQNVKFYYNNLYNYCPLQKICNV